MILLGCSPFALPHDNGTETVALTLLVLVTALLGSVTFPLDADAQVRLIDDFLFACSTFSCTSHSHPAALVLD